MIDPSKKTIIFDFGNVLVNLDFAKCFVEFEKVLKTDFSKGLPEKTQKALHRYEKGEINTEAFLWGLQQYNPTAEIRDIIAAWNSILGNLPQSRLDMLAELRKDYNVAMLSNINDLHEIDIHKQIKKRMSTEEFQTKYFDKVFYSHLIGYRKPDLECYQYVQETLGVKANDILFIDDMESNILAARSVGWQGQVHNPTEDIINNMSSYLQVAFGSN